MKIHYSLSDIEKFSKLTMENLVEVKTNMEQMLPIWNSKYLSEPWSKIWKGVSFIFFLVTEKAGK